MARSPLILAAYLLALTSLLPGSVHASTIPRVRFLDRDGTEIVVVDRLDEQAISRLQKWNQASELPVKLLTVHAVDGKTLLPAMLGQLSFSGCQLVFRPRFDLSRRLRYSASFNASLLDAADRTIETVREPLEVIEASRRVTEVFPSASRLPENTLRFYLHFSGPMSQGEAYRHIQLLDSSGRPVAHPFLELGEELWDRSGTRFTLLFDPGRVKRGLEPRNRFGPALKAGQKYTLVVKQDWPDSSGAGLLGEFRKEFTAVAADHQQPDPGKWKWTRPTAGTFDPLVVRFNEPLDRAMLLRVLRVSAPGQIDLKGEISVDENEQVWSFTPAKRWMSGTHFLSVNLDLEDRAGNSVSRPFEVDVFDRIDERIRPRMRHLPFFVPE